MRPEAIRTAMQRPRKDDLAGWRIYEGGGGPIKKDDTYLYLIASAAGISGRALL
jgi:hypothetical protein